MTNEQVERLNEFRNALRRFAKSTDGELVLKVLKEEYVEVTALAKTPEHTHYKLGQKELIQLLLKEAAGNTEGDNEHVEVLS